jgi:hypothetical protein
LVTLTLDAVEVQTLELALSRLNDTMGTYREQLSRIRTVRISEIDSTDQTLAVTRAILRKLSEAVSISEDTSVRLMAAE